jgi:hypothetical protein
MGMKGTPCQKATLKQMFKRHAGIDSLGPLDNKGMTWFLTKTMILLAQNWSIEIDLPGEENVQDMEMREFINLIYGKE